jgi:tetratricopeptide (TPR) repeat protein
MKKSVGIVVVLASLAVVGLYSLPRTLVKNEKRTLDVAQKADSETKTTDDHSHDSDDHSQVSATQQQKINQLRTAFENAPVNAKEKAMQSLANEYVKAMRYDSAAWATEQIAIAQPNEQNWFRAGSTYYQAFTFAEGEKAARLGQKVRDAYEKTITLNPNNLVAKTNMAMTYVSTPEPMKGIAMLREVIQQDPNNELALFSLGQLSMRSNQYEKAVDRFKQIVKNNPNNLQASYLLGVCYAEMGKKEEARKTLEILDKQTTDPQLKAAVKEILEKL